MRPNRKKFQKPAGASGTFLRERRDSEIKLAQGVLSRCGLSGFPNGIAHPICRSDDFQTKPIMLTDGFQTESIMLKWGHGVRKLLRAHAVKMQWRIG